MKNLFCFIILVFLCHFNLSSQCYSDRHSTGAHEGWISCETSKNPNDVLGNTHWLLYDLSASFSVYDMHLWNQNHPEFRSAGVKDFMVHHSLDQATWTLLDTFSLPQASATAIYEGYRGVDFEGQNVRYILITPINNYGSNCFGISEVKIYTSDIQNQDLEFAFQVCETDGILKNVSGGMEKNGTYSGPGVSDNGDDSFDFDPDVLGPGEYTIEYEFTEAGQQTILDGTIIILPCTDLQCGDCPECNTYTQNDIDDDPIPENTYQGDSIQSVGTVGVNTDVAFRASDEIDMNIGFEVEGSSAFFAQIRDCQINQISNHSFESGLDDWDVIVNSLVMADYEVVPESFEGDSALYIKTLSTYTDSTGVLKWWLVRARQQYFSVEENQKYEISFAAKSDANRTVVSRVQNSADPYQSYANVAFKLKPYWKTYRFEFVADQTLIDLMRFRLFCGYEVGEYWLDNVRIVPID